MQLLSIFNTGGLTLGLTLVWLALGGWFLYNYLKVKKAGYIIDKGKDGGLVHDPTKVKNKQNAFFWGMIVITGLYIIAMIAVAIDYKGV